MHHICLINQAKHVTFRSAANRITPTSVKPWCRWNSQAHISAPTQVTAWAKDEKEHTKSTAASATTKVRT